MIARWLIPAMLAARRTARQANPGLDAAMRACWNVWLRSQRRADAVATVPQLTIFVALSCADDLFLHVGLMQLLNLSTIRCSVVFILPTSKAARLVEMQARREEWHTLVQFAEAEQLPAMVGRLLTQARFVIFPAPSAVSSQVISAITGQCQTSLRDRKAMWRSACLFFGNAADYLAWSDAIGEVSERRMEAAVRSVMVQDPASLRPSVEEAHNDSEGNPEPWTGTLFGQLGRVELALSGAEDELVISVADEQEPRIVARQMTALSDPERALRIRMPPSLITTAPNVLRLETRSPYGLARAVELSFHVPASRLKPWMLSAFLNKGGGGNPVIRAFARGVGCRIAYAEDEPDVLHDIPVVWGVLRDSDRILAQAKAQGLYFFYIDHAYFNRGHGKTYRITRNAYEAGPIRQCPPGRFADLDVKVAPWRKGGRGIVVCPPTDYFMKAHNCPNWLRDTLATLQAATDRPIHVRRKPQPGEKEVPLPKALETAHALVTHSSNVAIEAACLGTPIFVDPASAAAPIGATDLSAIESPIYPDREAWLAHLAYNQFSFDEIGDGRAWRMLLELEERDFV